MVFPWANTLLLVLILVELVSGLLGLLYGSVDEAALMATHRIAGYGIVAVLLWEVRNAPFSLRRPEAAAPRTATVVLSVLLLSTLVVGLVWSWAGPFVFAGFSGVSWHIYLGTALAPLLAWHTVGYTRGLAVGVSADRRSFLRLAGIAALGAVLWQLSEAGARATALAGASRRFTGSYESGERKSGGFPVVSWLNDAPPSTDMDSWRLRVTGAVASDVEWRFSELSPTTEIGVIIDCTGGWYSEQVWRGIPLSTVLERSEPDPEAASVTIGSATGYYRRFSMAEASGYLLATHVGERSLSLGHGFPVRLVAPGKRGFEWVKWTDRIEVNDGPKWLQSPLPVQ